MLYCHSATVEQIFLYINSLKNAINFIVLKVTKLPWKPHYGLTTISNAIMKSILLKLNQV